MNPTSDKKPLNRSEIEQFLLAASNIALQKLEAHFPHEPETALLLLAIQKALGVQTAEG